MVRRASLYEVAHGVQGAAVEAGYQALIGEVSRASRPVGEPRMT
jgi:hypothetical protein